MRRAGWIGVLGLMLACGGASLTEQAGPSSLAVATTGSCPEGVNAAPSWPGEWPTPIPHVTQPIEVQARTEPCGAWVTCKLEPGVYHPWSDSAGDTAYAQVTAIRSYRATRAVTLHEVSVPKDAVVTVTRYLGEGFCEGTIASVPTDTFSCPNVGDGSFEERSAVAFDHQNIFRPACGAWVDAEALMKEPGVVPGAFGDYGTAGPQPKTP